jgi:glycosyltransferase 2 family protein
LISAKDIIKTALSLGLAAFFLWSAFQSVNLLRVWEILLESDVVWLMGSVLLIVLATYPRAYRWRILISPVIPFVPIRKLFTAILIGYAGNNLIPRAGEIAKIWAIDRDPKRMSSLVATVAVERLLDLIILMGMFTWVTILIREKLASVFPWMGGTITMATIVIAAATVFLLALSLFGDRLLDRVDGASHHPLIKRLLGLCRSFLQGTEAIRSPKAYFGIAIWTLLLNAAYIGAMYLPFFAFDFHAKYQLGLQDALVVLTIATLGIIIPTPGGAGTYHYFCRQALHGLYGIPLEEAIAFATVVHGLTYVMFLVLGGPGLVTLIWRKRATDVAQASA